MEHMISNDELINLEHEAMQDMEEKSKKITVPKVQSMDYYILQTILLNNCFSWQCLLA